MRRVPRPRSPVAGARARRRRDPGRRGSAAARDGRLAEHDRAPAALVRSAGPAAHAPRRRFRRRGAGVRTLGNVTLLERPVRVTALASAVRSALRARERQYQTRAHLHEREQADRRKDEFLATLAHELRNPLAPIRNSVNVLRLSGAAEPAGADLGHDGPPGQPHGAPGRRPDGSVAHHARQDRAAQGGARPRRRDRRRRGDQPPADRGRASRADGDAAAEPLVVEADPVRLAQVFSNLLNNAAKYTDAGGRIRIVARREDGSAVVTVSDTGIGIAADGAAAASSTCSCRPMRATAARRAASASA